MKFISLIILLFTALTVPAGEKVVESGVYKWIEEPAGKETPFTKSLILQGKTSDLESFEVSAASLFQGEEFAQHLAADNSDVFLIVKDGTLDLNLGSKHKSISKGGVAYLLPEESYTLVNRGQQPASCFFIRMNAKKPVDLKRGKDTGGSFMIDMEEKEFKPHDKGGLRDYFRGRPTAMFGFTEMHVTTLNPQIKSHEPHTHPAAELVLMLAGNTEMQIGDQMHQARAGDFYFLDSEVSHAIRNTEDTPCMYVAFQWE